MANNTNNGKTTTTTPKAPNHRGWYATVFQGWQVKQLGPQPTNEQLGVIHALGARPGKQAMANAMALRDQGVTGNQIKAAASLFDGNPTPQLNKMRAFVDVAGVLAWVPMPASGDGKVYRTKLTERGKAMIKTMADKPLHATPSLKAASDKAKPAKAPVAAKPKRVAKAKGAAKPAEGAKHPFSAGGPSSPAATAASGISSTPPSARTVLTEAGPKVIGQGDQAKA